MRVQVHIWSLCPCPDSQLFGENISFDSLVLSKPKKYYKLFQDSAVVKLHSTYLVPETGD